MLHELKFAFRSLVKTPGFTAVALITVALAIAANTAVFSLVNALLIRPLPFKDPQKLVLLFEKFSGDGTRPNSRLGARVSRLREAADRATSGSAHSTSRTST